MFKRNKQPPIRSLIALGCQMEGHFSFADGLRVDGEMKGDITGLTSSRSMLVVSESATVTGTIEADHIVINGRVDGPVRARVMLELQPKAKIVGDVSYKALEMHRGAVVEGHLCPFDAEFVDAISDTEKPTLKLAANNL